MKSIYLINPHADTPTYFGAESYAAYGFEPAVWLSDLATTTVAAMVPSDFGVAICDEHIAPVDFETSADFIGITGKINQERRMVELAREFRRRGKVVLLGGPHASLSPDRLRGECDILVRGEIENIAAQLFGDLRCRKWKREYIGDKPDLRNSPVPRWDLYPNQRAASATVQTSRGCPFECEFCDVIQYLGRTQRHKEPPQVIAELEELYHYGYRNVFLADDNFTVFRARAKELLIALRDWNDSRTEGRVSFSTQVSIDCARDPELLRLCADAALVYAFVGIETPNEASLKETKKRQNVGIDMVSQVEILLAHGISVTGGMIVGFDNDTRDIFEQQYDFAMSSPIPLFSLSPLSAPAATPLHARMQRENRLVEHGFESSAVLPWITNVIPAQMSMAELLAGVRWLCNRLYRAEAFGERVLRFIDKIEPQPARCNSRSGGKPRAVDLERTLVAGRVLRLGDAEGEMIAVISKRLEGKPNAAGYVMPMISHYMQIRHVYETGGVWDAALGAEPRPRWDTAFAVSPLVPASRGDLVSIDRAV